METSALDFGGDQEEDIEVDEEEDDENLDASEIAGDEEGEENRDNEEDSGPIRAPQDFTEFVFDFERGEDPSSTDDVEEKHARLAGLWGDGDKVLTAKVNKNRRFVCIDYPGVVHNVDKAMATMEGLSSISNALSENGRLPVFFRPEDPYCKPTYANCSYSQNLLLKIRRRRKKQAQSGIPSGGSSSSCTGDNNQSPYEYQLVVEGIVDRIYTFDALCDFQYLPVVRNATLSSGEGIISQSHREILSQIVPDFEDQRLEYLSRPAPLYVPPLTFSRRQVPVRFHFDDDQPSRSKRQDLIETERKMRILSTIHLTFDHVGVPLEPHPDSFCGLEKLPKKIKESGMQAVRKIFEMRPMWSKVGLEMNMEAPYKRYLTYLLPMVAFYFTNGAWKNLWCKLGYDPRTHPEAKIYQIIDFRIRKKIVRTQIDGKRDMMSKRGRQNPGTSLGASGSSNDMSLDIEYIPNQNATYATKMMKKTPIQDLSYVYHQGQLPPYRQMRYQLCDIHHPSIQAMLHENDGKETDCTERDGWCVPDFTDICRDILHNEVEKLQALSK